MKPILIVGFGLMAGGVAGRALTLDSAHACDCIGTESYAPELREEGIEGTPPNRAYFENLTGGRVSPGLLTFSDRNGSVDHALEAR